MTETTYARVLEQALKLSALDQARLAEALAAAIRERLESLSGASESDEKPMALIGDELREIAAGLGDYPGKLPPK